MRSRKSFFDARIYRSALSRYWLLGLAYAAVLVYIFFSYLRGYGWYGMDETAGLRLLRVTLARGPMLCMIASAVMAMAAYSWLFFPRQAAFTAALPIRREAVFLSHMAAGFTILLGGSVLSLGLVTVLGGLDGVTGMELLCWMGIVVLLTVLFFGFASFCAGLTGSIFVLPAVYAVFLYAAVALEASFRRIVQFIIFGLNGRSWRLTALSPAYHLRVYADNMLDTCWLQTADGAYGYRDVISLTGFRGWPLLLGYGLAGLAFIALSVLLIRRRTMESAGDIVAVPGLRRLFPWGAALAGALTLALLSLKTVFGYTGYYPISGSFPQVLLLLLILLTGAFVGWFGAQGLLRKSFRVFDRSWGGFAVVCAVLTAAVLGMELDIFGVERALPKAEDVASVRIWDSASSADVVLHEPENIRSAIELQEHIIANKALFESVGNGGRTGGSALEISYYDAYGKPLLLRTYAAAPGVMAWSSGGDAWITYDYDYYWATYGDAWASCGDAWASYGDAWTTYGDAWASYGDAWASYGDAWTTYGDAWVTYGDAWTTYGDAWSTYGDAWATSGNAPWGSANPVLEELQELVNTPEAILSRLSASSMPVSALTMDSCYITRTDDYYVTDYLELRGLDAWEFYRDCLVPDARERTVGWIQLCPQVIRSDQRGDATSITLRFTDGYGSRAVSEYLFINIQPEARRTWDYLRSRGFAWTEEPEYYWTEPEEIISEAVSHDLDRLEGLAALLEKAYLEYDPNAAGSVGAMRWSRSMLEWFSENGNDPFLAYEQAKLFAGRYLIESEDFPERVETLRTGGLRMASNGTGLVRDRGRNADGWAEDTVNALFDAILAGIGQSPYQNG